MTFLREMFLFGVSGILGFVVDTAVLYALQIYLGPFVARGISFFFAVLTTWIFNRRITFGNRRSGLQKQSEFFSYLVLMLAGGVVNYAVYAWLVLNYQLVAEHLVIGVAIGSLAGMCINYATSRIILFRRRV
jgi:putative flippase GtrA